MKTNGTFTLAIFLELFLCLEPTRAASVTLTPVTGLGRLHGINQSSQVAGHTIGGDDVNGFLYDNGTVIGILIPNADSEQTFVYGIENNGRVVGSYTVSGSTTPTHGFLYFHGDVTNIDYPGAESTVARGINDPQRIVGYYRPAGGNRYYGFFYDKKSFTTIPDVSSAVVNTYATGINNPRDIVGYYTAAPDANGQPHDHGFLYDKKGNLTTIDVPFANVTDTHCYGINSSGVIVGSYIDRTGTHGFVDIAGIFTSVDAPGTPPGVGTFVQGINDNGQVTVFGTTAFLGNINY